MTEPAASPHEPEAPSRRRFFLGLLLGAGAAVVASLGAAASALILAPLRRARGPAFVRLDLGSLESFDAVRKGGGPREVVTERSVADGYLTRRMRERFYVVPDASAPAGLAVLGTTCSHLGCGVSWSSEKGAFLCPCHGGVYGLDGHVLAGPPPRPLERPPLVVEGGRLALDLGSREST